MLLILTLLAITISHKSCLYIVQTNFSAVRQSQLLTFKVPVFLAYRSHMYYFHYVISAQSLRYLTEGKMWLSAKHKSEQLQNGKKKRWKK